MCNLTFTLLAKVWYVTFSRDTSIYLINQIANTLWNLYVLSLLKMYHCLMRYIWLFFCVVKIHKLKIITLLKMFLFQTVTGMIHRGKEIFDQKKKEERKLR